MNAPQRQPAPRTELLAPRLPRALLARIRPIAGLLLLAAALLWRRPLEASMLLHMIAQLPMILLGGLLLAGPAARRSARVARYDRHGLSGLTALLLVTAYWMIPRALEQSISMPLAELGKFLSVAALGLLLPGTLARANTVIQLFYLGNFCAMTAIAGMLYQDLPERLCNAYLQDDQVLTGACLTIASVAAAVAWCVHNFPALTAPTTPAPH